MLYPIDADGLSPEPEAVEAVDLADSTSTKHVLDNGVQHKHGALLLRNPSATNIAHQVVTPDYSVGGYPSPGTLNQNFGTGQKSLNQITGGSKSGVPTPGSVRYDPVIGSVGLTNRATSRIQGVQAQAMNTDTSTLEGAARFVGITLKRKELGA